MKQMKTVQARKIDAGHTIDVTLKPRMPRLRAGFMADRRTKRQGTRKSRVAAALRD